VYHRHYTLILHVDRALYATVNRLLRTADAELLTLTGATIADHLEALLRAPEDVHATADRIRHALTPLDTQIRGGRLVYDGDGATDIEHDLYCRHRADGCRLPPHNGRCHPGDVRPPGTVSVVDTTVLGELGPYRTVIADYMVSGAARHCRLSRRQLDRLAADLHRTGRGSLEVGFDETARLIHHRNGRLTAVELNRDDDGLYALPESVWHGQAQPIRTRPAYHAVVFHRAHVHRPDLPHPYPVLLIDPGHRGVVPWLARNTLLRLADDLAARATPADASGEMIVLADPAAVMFRFDHDRHEAAPIAVIQPNQFGLYPWGRGRTSWTAETATSAPLTIATVAVGDTGITVEAFVPAASQPGQQVTALLSISGIRHLATELSARGHDLPARLHVNGHTTWLRTPGGPARGSLIRPDAFGLHTVAIDDEIWCRLD
jgi:hypothetical protein